MRLGKIFLILPLLFSACMLHGKTEDAPLRLEICSATYGKGAQSADITETVRKAVKGGTCLEFHNHSSRTRQNLRIRNSDKVIRLVSKLGGEKKELDCVCSGRIKIGAPALKFQSGTPEWIAHFIDCSGGAPALTCSGNPTRGESHSCPKCKKGNCIAFLPFEEDHMQCSRCGFVFSEKILPITGADVFEDMKLEYHQLPGGKKIYWKPILRSRKAQCLSYEVDRMSRKDPAATAGKRLDAMRMRNTTEHPADELAAPVQLAVPESGAVIPERPGYLTLNLGRPLPKSGILRLALTESGSGDPCTVMTSRTINISK